jgi:hypothetical protein
MTIDLYEKDFYVWCAFQSSLIEQKNFEYLDYENLIEEIQSLGKQQKRILRNRLCLLFMYLLKWEYQKDLRTNSWILTIREKIKKVNELIIEMPSLKHELAEISCKAYQDARYEAHMETKLNYKIFPEVNPFNLEEELNREWTI